MGHDIAGYNKEGKEIAYARFSMGNPNARIIYNVLDATKYDAGVSGSGVVATYTVEQMERALNNFKELCKRGILLSDIDSLPWDQKQIYDFIINCRSIAQKEGNVRVCFA
ncbi:hypothetical protein ACOQFO_02595 [Ureibacillus sp. MALMAid1270]|uniref:hypothetical protein n=1 Tax=Ureibacillus sp. MALMAid1270 TaxID=3411629 RepID=UPI003BA76DB4